MTDKPYSNREIVEMFKDVKEALIRIETQTIRTNGRVNRLEGWRMWIVGGLAAFGLTLVPTFGYVVYKTINLDASIQAAVAQALLPYAK